MLDSELVFAASLLSQRKATGSLAQALRMFGAPLQRVRAICNLTADTRGMGFANPFGDVGARVTRPGRSIHPALVVPRHRAGGCARHAHGAG